MAYRPSFRSHNKVSEIPLDIRPVMNLMVVLIPILLYSAEFVKLSIRELNLPPASSTGTAINSQDNKPKEKELRFNLSVTISKRGFYIANDAGLLSGDAKTGIEEGVREPSVPLKEDGSYDYAALVSKLVEIKEKIEGKGFIDEKSIIISAEADIPYKHIIKVIDNVTVYEDADGNRKELFPQINIGQVI
jgi:biopolymer transport protein ExbD